MVGRPVKPASKADRAGDIAGTVALWVVAASMCVAAAQLFESQRWSPWWAPLAIVLIVMASTVAYLITATTVDLIVWRHRARLR